MKTFEEKFTAWVDGALSGAELAAFERELEAHPEARAEKEDCLQLGNLLRTHLVAPPLDNPDFFQHQLLRQMAAESPAAPAARAERSRWGLPRLAWAGAFCLLMAAFLYEATVPKSERALRKNQEYVANILSSHTDDPAITATAFHDGEDNVTVLWLDGLKYIPENHKLK